MFHGGENPDGKLTTLEEAQASGGWNDLPVKIYDFQLRPSVNTAKFVHNIIISVSFTSFCSTGSTQLPTCRRPSPTSVPAGKDDFDTVRWCVRSDGKSGLRVRQQLPASP